MNSKVIKITGFIVWSFAVLIVGVMIGQSPSSSPSVVNSVDDSSVKEVVEDIKADNQSVVIKSETLKQNSGYAEVVGEVINNRKNPVTFVKVTATFYDKDKKVIGTAFTFAGDTSDTPLEYQKTTPFELSSYPDKFIPASYKLDVTWN